MPNAITRNATISVCEVSYQPKRTPQLEDHMPTGGIMPNAITYNATISVCEVSCQPERTLQLQADTPTLGIISSEITYNATISVCDVAHQSERAPDECSAHAKVDWRSGSGVWLSGGANGGLVVWCVGEGGR